MRSVGGVRWIFGRIDCGVVFLRDCGRRKGARSEIGVISGVFRGLCICEGALCGFP